MERKIIYTYFEKYDNPKGRIKETSSLKYILSSFKRVSKKEDAALFSLTSFKNNYRRSGNAIESAGLTLDADNAPAAEEFLAACEAVPAKLYVYSTPSHGIKGNRFRVVVPFLNNIPASDYERVSKAFITKHFDPAWFDNCSWNVSQAMYLPVKVSDDQETIYFETSHPSFLNPAPYLQPTSPQRTESQSVAPAKKPGLIGAFCRAYTVEQAIEKFLSDIYVDRKKSLNANEIARYRYYKADSEQGLVIYKDNTAFSFHNNTDPAAGVLLNAYDLVRIHKFNKDEQEMRRFVASLEEVEHGEEFKQHSNSIELEVTAKGAVKNSFANAQKIFEQDPVLRDVVGHDVIRGVTTWRKDFDRFKRGDQVRLEFQYTRVRKYINEKYGVDFGKNTIIDLLEDQADKNQFNPFLERIEAVEWDGVKRIDTVFQGWLKVEGHPAVSALARAFFVGIVTRQYEPGAKCDIVPVLVGAQGCGKSIFAERLGFTDFFLNVNTFDGKQALEEIHQCVVAEISELSAIRKSSIEQVKKFLTSSHDTFRPAYARQVVQFPRRSLFIATTNTDQFLNDDTGNRRFFPLDCQGDMRDGERVYLEFTEELVEQLYAEAIVLYKQGVKAHVAYEHLSYFNKQRAQHEIYDDRDSVVEEYLTQDMPAYQELDSIEKRQEYYAGKLDFQVSTQQRKYVCALEVFCEALGGRKGDFTPYKAKEINALLERIGLTPAPRKRLGTYGRPRKVYEIPESFRNLHTSPKSDSAAPSFDEAPDGFEDAPF